MKKSKTKLLLSLILAAVMICVSVVPAFATATADESSADLQNEKTNLWEYVYNTKINYYPSVGGGVWYSIESIERLFGVAEKIENEYLGYTTQEEIDEAYRVFNDALSKMYVDPYDLNWMLEYMEKDYNSTGYYDEETAARIKAVYEEAQRVYNAEDEAGIHSSFIEMRNLLNEICVYNTVPGDVDKSGKLDIRDVALMQLDLAKLNKENFNSSQRYIASFNKNTNIITVSDWQLALAKLNDGSIITDVKKNIDDLLAEEKIAPDCRDFAYENSEVNVMYCYDRYIRDDVYSDRG